MVLVVNQDTFDDAVKENIAEFGMSAEEAVDDAVKQFETQGVDLSNIIKNLMLSKPGDTHIVSTAITALGNLVKAKRTPKSSEEFQEQLAVIRSECDKGLEYRVLASKEGAYKVIMDVMINNEKDAEVIKECLKALISLMTKQPDLLDDKGIKTIIACLDKQEDPEIQKLLLQWVKECCIMHELNRQHIFEAGILNHLKPLLEHASSSLLRDVLAVLRALVLDDDVRVDFGRAHEHARAIASDTLCQITTLLSKFKTEEPLMTDVMLTLSALLVRNEFCKKVEDAGGLDMIKDVMITFHDKDKITRQCFKLLKVLAGNDEVKARIIQKELAPIIASSLNRHKDSPQTVSTGLGCIAALTLRSPDNSKTMFEAGAPEVIVESMRRHLDDVHVQKNGSWAIRNMVSRSRYQSDKFLALGVEEILIKDIKKFTNCEYDIKSALRDLGCKVNLKEEWTGKGGMITSETKKN